jgi:hypothetical protein
MFYAADGKYEASIMQYVNKHALQSRQKWQDELLDLKPTDQKESTVLERSETN